LTKSGKSTDSFTFLGKIYRIFDEIRRVKDRLSGPEFLSLKTSPCLSKTAQTWREKPAKPLRLGVFSGKSFRHGEKIRLAPGAHQARIRRALIACQLTPPTWRETPSTPCISAQETRYPHEVDTG